MTNTVSTVILWIRTCGKLVPTKAGSGEPQAKYSIFSPTFYVGFFIRSLNTRP